MAEFKYFRNLITGKVGSYPADFGDLFYDTFVEVDSNAADCIDCGPTKQEYQDALVTDNYDRDDDDELIRSFVDDDDDFPDPVVTPTTHKDK